MSSPSTLRLEISKVINTIPEQNLSQVLELLRQFSTTDIVDSLGDNSALEEFEEAMIEISMPTVNGSLKKRVQLQQLFEDWKNIDSEEEQQKTLEIFQSLERIIV